MTTIEERVEMKNVDGFDARMVLDRYGARLETINDLLSVVSGDLLNFNHVDAHSADSKEKLNATIFCDNFTKINTLVSLAVQETSKLIEEVKSASEEIETGNEVGGNDD